MKPLAVTMKLHTLLVASAFTTLTAGCALMGKADALSVRFYSPEQAERARLTAAESQAARDAKRPAVELGRVTSGFQLREKVLRREGAHELSAYDDRRWTERPEVYVRRALARTLFEERGFQRVLIGTAPVLEVEVISFEEVHVANTHAARIQLRIMLHDGRDVLLEETLTIEKPVVATVPRGDSFDGFVHAMAQALDEATNQIATRLERIGQDAVDEKIHEKAGTPAKASEPAKEPAKERAKDRNSEPNSPRR